MYNDVRFAVRLLRKNPGFTAVGVLTLALGIGANTAIFSVVNVVLLRPLPYPDSDRLVFVASTQKHLERWYDWVSYPDFVDWRNENTAFEDMAAYRSFLFNLTGGEHPEALPGLFVSAGLFSVLRVEPMLGRPFLPGEDQLGRNRVAIVSYGLWQRRFGSDPGLIGKAIQIDGESYTVVGVMPPGLRFPPPAVSLNRDVYVPGTRSEERNDRFSHNHWVVACLNPGVTIEQAQANMEAIARGLAERYPADRDMGARVTLLHEKVANSVRPALLVLMGSIGLVLLIACANLANLLLARGAARQKEIAVRHALGASRGHLLWQWLAESVLLALLGGAVGLLLAFQGIAFLRWLGPNLPRLEETTIDMRVLTFSLLLSVLSGLIFGVAPALHGSKIDLQEALKKSGTRTAGLGRNGTRSLLVVTEMALAMMLLVSAGLLMRSFVRLYKVDPGFNPESVLTGWVLLPISKYSEPRRQAVFFKEALERIESLPGVVAAGGSSSVPLIENDTGGIQIEGRPEPHPGELAVEAERPKVTPGYFRAIGIPLLRGRTFSWADSEGSLPVALISKKAAELYWPGEDPIGKRVNIYDGGEQRPVWRQVVGIVGDVRHDGLAEKARPGIYVPLLQSPTFFTVLAVRTHTDPGSLSATIRHELMAVDKDQPVFDIRTMEQVVSESMSDRRFQMILLGIFALVALSLAVVGIYGVMSYSVSQRVQEIGIRMALGADRNAILRLVVGQGFKLTMIGLAVGLAGAFALTRVLSSLLYGVTTTDPATFVGVSLLLVGVALLACYIPARRATKVDPMVALRYE
jgi:putative ABC transport system permease protein